MVEKHKYNTEEVYIMTEKQSISFIQMPPTKDFYMRCQECCDWLNNLIKENKELKQENEELKLEIQQLKSVSTK